MAYLSFVLFRLNTAVRSQVALKQDRQARGLLLAAGVVLVHVPLALAALRRKGIAGNLILAGTHPPLHFWEVVFAVVAGDVLLRYLAVLAKVGLQGLGLAWPGLMPTARSLPVAFTHAAGWQQCRPTHPALSSCALPPLCRWRCCWPCPQTAPRASAGEGTS